MAVGHGKDFVSRSPAGPAWFHSLDPFPNLSPFCPLMFDSSFPSSPKVSGPQSSVSTLFHPLWAENDAHPIIFGLNIQFLPARLFRADPQPP